MMQTIFVVEDNEILSGLLEMKLKNIADTVKAFTNGAEAFEAIKNEHPELIILDIMLPGMEGFEILKKIKQDQDLKDIKVLMLTSKYSDRDVERGFELHADEYMNKPFKIKELVLRAKRLLN